MTDISDFLSRHEECTFVEVICTQTYDRVARGYADEWQFLVRGKIQSGKVEERELLYFAGADLDPEEFNDEYASKKENYIFRYSNIPVASEDRHHKTGIKQNQKLPLIRRI